jgi:hypothetical protein
VKFPENCLIIAEEKVPANPCYVPVKFEKTFCWTATTQNNTKQTNNKNSISSSGGGGNNDDDGDGDGDDDDEKNRN